MTSSKTNETDLRKQFLAFLNQPELCEQFYIYMKSEHLAYVLEFYLACDGLRNLLDDISKQGAIIELIYKHYLSNGKSLSSSKTKFSLSDEILCSIKQRLNRKEFHLKFYDQAQEYALKYMLQMCYPKFSIEQQQQQQEQSSDCKRPALTTPMFSPMHRRAMSMRKKDVFEHFKQKNLK